MGFRADQIQFPLCCQNQENETKGWWRFKKTNYRDLKWSLSRSVSGRNSNNIARCLAWTCPPLYKSHFHIVEQRARLIRIELQQKCLLTRKHAAMINTEITIQLCQHVSFPFNLRNVLWCHLAAFSAVPHRCLVENASPGFWQVCVGVWAAGYLGWEGSQTPQLKAKQLLGHFVLIENVS